MPAPLLKRIDLRAGSQQQLRSLHIAGTGHGHQRRFTFGIGRLNVSTGLEQSAHEQRIATLCRLGHRRCAIVVNSPRICSRLEQLFNTDQIAVMHRPMQRCGAITGVGPDTVCGTGLRRDN